MDLKIFFSPVQEETYNDISDSHSFFSSISVFTEKMPDYKGAHIALIGVEDARNTIDNAGCEKGAMEIRKKLYRLKKGSGSYRIVDLGNINAGVTYDETQLRIKEVCAILIEQDILPILIGGTHDQTYAQYLSYESMDKLVSLLTIDAFLDMDDDIKKIGSKNFLHHIMMHENNFLFNLCLMGYQSYLIDNDTLAILEKLYFDSYRLGYMRQGIQEMEPVIREADMLSFDITSIKSSDAPGNAFAQPFGLTGEEACQICWYAGLNEKMSSAGFYEYNPDYDDENRKTAAVVATMIWYFIEGYYHRKDESNFRGNYYLRYVVSMPEEPATIVFYKSKLSEKWWMEVPYPHGKFMYERNLIIPCSYSDYQLAQKGDVPERWIITQNKLV